MSCRPRLFGQLWPNTQEVVRPLILTTDRPTSCKLQANAVLRRREAVLVSNAPLSYLRVVLDVVAKLNPARTELRHGQGARGRQL